MLPQLLTQQVLQKRSLLFCVLLMLTIVHMFTTHLSGLGIGFGSSLYRFPCFQGIITNIDLIWKDSCMNLFAFGSHRHTTTSNKQRDHCMTQHKQSHRIKWHDHHIKWHDMHQNRSHHHHGTAEGSFTAKKWFRHRRGRSPCAHSIGKFFLCYIVLFSSETSAPGSPGNYLYIMLM